MLEDSVGRLVFDEIFNLRSIDFYERRPKILKEPERKAGSRYEVLFLHTVEGPYYLYFGGRESQGLNHDVQDRILLIPSRHYSVFALDESERSSTYDYKIGRWVLIGFVALAMLLLIIWNIRKKAGTLE